MLSFTHHRLVFCLAIGLATMARSQVAAPDTTATINDWADVQKAATDSLTTVRSGSKVLTGATDPTGKAGAVEISPIAAEFVNRADALRDFRLAHPEDLRAGEARRLEALMLVKAQSFSATIDTDRCSQLVAQARQDQSLPETDRFSLAFFADHQQLVLRQAGSERQRLEQFEALTRGLIAEFPTVPQGYEGLLNLAEDCPDDQAGRVAADLLTMNAPAAVKGRAQILADRCALVSRPLQTVLSAGLSAKALPVLAKNRITILYSWESSNEGSFMVAQGIAANAPAGATIIGLNLNKDLSAAKQVAAARGLPGLQLYDSAGPDSNVARALKLSRDVIVIIADRNGNISTVSGQLHLADKIAAANQ